MTKNQVPQFMQARTQPCPVCGQTFPMDKASHSHTTKESEMTKGICDICEEAIGEREYIRVEEGGSIPTVIICSDCLFSEEMTGKVDWAVDNAVTGEGHLCLDHAEPSGDLWACGMCGLVLEQAGDALVVPA